MGTKRSVLTDEKGLPLSVVLSDANTHDIKLLEATLDQIVVQRPKSSAQSTQNLCLDAGYTGSKGRVEKRGYMAHIRPRFEEKQELLQNPNFKARRWVVEGDLIKFCVKAEWESFFQTRMKVRKNESERKSFL